MRKIGVQPTGLLPQWGRLLGWLVVALEIGAVATAAGPEPISIDADFPGGNILVEKVQGDDVSLRQDLRHTSGWWFYWHFRVRGAGGRCLRFHFTNRNVFGPQGPCFSLDGGHTWAWLGPERSHDGGPAPPDGFVFRFPRHAADVRFCFAIPYVKANLKQFLDRHRGCSALRVGELCKTAKGRSVELLHLGCIDGPADHRLAVACRHHACESVASYVLEGLMEAVLAENDTGRWFRRHVAIVAIPFVDKDGVEAGDQGKNRTPHDHNRDYAGASLYAEVAAIKRLLPQWSGGRLDMAIDLHCPYLHDRVLQFVGTPHEAIWQRTLRLSRCLESGQRGPLRHDAQRNLPFGKGWNTGDGLRNATFAAWTSSLPGIQVATTLEIPYAQVDDVPVSVDAARALGHDLANAIRCYFETR